MSDATQQHVGDVEVTVQRSGPVLELCLNRPHRRNALTVGSVGTILQALNDADESNATRCVIVHGAGDRAFCAGFDLDQKEGAGDRLTSEDRDLVEQLAGRFETCRLPIIAAINGVAVGAGCDLALSADIRLGTTAAAFGMPPAKLGILYGWKGMQRLLTVAGPSLAREMLLTGGLVGADRALRLGLLREIAPSDQLLPAARALAATISANAPLSVAGSKRSLSLLLGGQASSPAAVAQLEGIQREVWDSQDALEGLRARRAKRATSFAGR